jgi:hypothetical protein
MKTFATIFLVVVIIVGAGFLLFKFGNNAPGSKPSLSEAPNTAVLKTNMEKAGLDVLSAEGTVMHIHQHLDLNINGTAYNVPANIGIAASFISPIHTHDTSGILHVESPVVKDFKLGQFFDEWGITFNDNCIADFCADDTHKLVVGVNGTAITNAKDHILAPHEEIEVWYGPITENPTLIGSYTFEPGL